MTFAAKIRAGRAYLQWTQDELAHMADLSLQGIQRIERGELAPTTRTQQKLLRAFEKNGVSFTDRGFEYSETPIFFVEGETHEATYLQVLDDVGEHLQGQRSPELLIHCADDRVSPASVRNKYRELRANGVRMRQLVEEGNTYLMGPTSEYRYIPEAFFLNRVKLIYGDRIGNVGSDVLRVAIKADPLNAEVERNTFNLLWGRLAEPTESDADERF